MYLERREMFFLHNNEPVLLKNGLFWNSSMRKLEKGDLVIERGLIKEIQKGSGQSFSGKVLDIKGKIVAPGFFDMHVHFREPGREDKETIATGTAAAAAGGFTGTCPMPNTNPVIDNQGMVKFILDKSRDLLVDVYPIGAITKGQEGIELADIGDMVKAGAVAISDDGFHVKNTEVMRHGLEYAKMFGIPVITHAIDTDLSANGVMHESFYSTKLGLPGNPSAAEEIAIFRDIRLSEYTGASLHIAHVSCKDSINLIRTAKNNGINVTCEVTPHHIALTDKSVETFDSNFKMNPPLRSEEDVEAVKKGLVDGTIDAIATDHAPHTIEEKENEFIDAPFGVTGLETAFGVIGKYLLNPGILTLEQLIEKIVIAPRKILNLPVPEIVQDQTANLTILDTDEEWKVDKKDFYSLSHNNSFLGETLRGRIYGVFNKEMYWFCG